MMVRTIAIALATAALTAAVPSAASQIFSTGYDMPNGATGSYAYWDVGYTGSGCTNCNGAYLSGGSGKLTDGIAAVTPWYDYPTASNNSGTGQYVGWYYYSSPNPTITFHFSGSPTITGLSIQMDNSNYGGVSQPGGILIDGVNTPFAPLQPASIGWINFTGLNLTGNTHTLQFLHDDYWVFASEVTFDGSAIPEPASWATMVAGFGLLGGMMRSRRRAIVTS